jgi:hypothetical protein
MDARARGCAGTASALRAHEVFMRSILIVMLLAATAEAQLPPDEVTDWRLELQPYLFLPVDTTGDLVIGGMEVPVNVSLGDITDKLQYVAQFRLEAWKKRLGVVLDTTWAQLGNARDTRNGAPVAYSSRAFTGDMFGAARAFAFRGEKTYPVVSLELEAGVRLKHTKSAVEVGPLMRDADDWRVAGLVGLRVPFRVARLWLVSARAQMSVPGPDWMVNGGFTYTITPQWGVEVSYRVDGLNSDDDPEVDLIAHGPYVGFGFRFGDGPIR